jgi:hypothetical protein
MNIMTLKKLSFLIILLSCNIATADETQLEIKIKQIEAERASNDAQIKTEIVMQGEELHVAQISLATVNNSVIPSLQSSISKLSADDAEVHSKYAKLKIAAMLFIGVVLFLLVDRVLGIVPTPYKWYIAGGVTIIAETILYFKI